jgi:competence ComEA-like helix-hairpin-helix protein
MFLNRRERVAVLILCGTLCVGIAVSYYKNRYPGRVEEFGVVKGAVRPPLQESGDTSNAAAPAAVRDTAGFGEPIDLNLAPPEVLERLPRIGPALARRIADYRERNGPFRAVDDLRRVKGIGPKTLDLLRPHVKVSQPLQAK